MVLLVIWGLVPSVFIDNTLWRLQITECEIFLSMLVKFLESDKPHWLRTLALEVLKGVCTDPNLCQYVARGTRVAVLGDHA